MMNNIVIRDLAPNDIGRPVIFNRVDGKQEKGVLKANRNTQLVVSFDKDKSGVHLVNPDRCQFEIIKSAYSNYTFFNLVNCAARAEQLRERLTEDGQKVLDGITAEFHEAMKEIQTVSEKHAKLAASKPKKSKAKATA